MHKEYLFFNEPFCNFLETQKLQYHSVWAILRVGCTPLRYIIISGTFLHKCDSPVNEMQFLARISENTDGTPTNVFALNLTHSGTKMFFRNRSKLCQKRRVRTFIARRKHRHTLPMLNLLHSTKFLNKRLYQKIEHKKNHQRNMHFQWNVFCLGKNMRSILSKSGLWGISCTN